MVPAAQNILFPNPVQEDTMRFTGTLKLRASTCRRSSNTILNQNIMVTAIDA